MISQAERQSENRECRIRPAAGGKHGATGDVEISEAMDATIRIDDPFSRARGHPSRSHMVIAADRVVADQGVHLPGRFLFPEPRTRLGTTEGESSELAVERLHHHAQRSFVDFAETPIERDLRQSEDIAFL
jgi:hypothetical protein